MPQMEEKLLTVTCQKECGVYLRIIRKRNLIKLSNLLNKRKESKRLRIWNFNPTFLFYTAYIIYKSFTLTVVSDFEINVTLE